MSKVEDVLLVIPAVKYKKSDGTLYVMKERIAFMAENRETTAVSHSFYDVKSNWFLKSQGSAILTNCLF